MLSPGVGALAFHNKEQLMEEQEAYAKACADFRAHKDKGNKAGVVYEELERLVIELKQLRDAVKNIKD